jgi:serine/threonine protein kinase
MLKALALIFLHVAAAAPSAILSPEEFVTRYRCYTDELVGTGSFSKVYRGLDMEQLQTLPDGLVFDADEVDLSDPSNVCIKYTRMPAEKYREDHTLNELNALNKIGASGHIIKVHNACEVCDYGYNAAVEVYAAQEFANGGSLSQAISRGLINPPADLGLDATDSANMKLDLIGRILGHILHALQQMHTSGFAHCDIKPSNIVLSAPGIDGYFLEDGYVPELSFADLQRATYKLVDFDFLKSLGNNPTERSLNDASGTIAYASPAQLNWTWDHRKHRLITDPYGAGADIWALGLTAYKLWTQSYITDLPMFTALLNPDPDVKETTKMRINRILEIRKTWKTFVSNGGLAQVIAEFPIELQLFISACLTIEEAERPTATELLGREFITRALNGTSLSSLPPLSTTTAIDIESSSDLLSSSTIFPPIPPAFSSDQTVSNID